MPTFDFHARPAPVKEYGAALETIQQRQAREVAMPGFNPALQTILLTHGKKVGRCVLWFHGYTAATLQFKPLAELCYQRGYNALVPCFPHHGFKDRMTPEVSQVRAEELVRFADEMVDLAHGLGDEVIVGGLSMGGAMTAWVAQERPDVAKAILVAAFLGGKIIPAPLTWLAAKAMQLAPDQRQWWDPAKKENCEGPDYGYPQRSTHSLVQILDVGFKVFDFARQKPPAAGKVWVVINDNDESVSNDMIERLARAWQQRARAQQVEVFHFPVSLGVPHDCISIEQPKANTKVVYEELMRMVG
jgi:carboxylesterase